MSDRYAVTHKVCGGMLGWFLGLPYPGDRVRAETFLRLNGSHPVPGERFAEYCPKCLKFVRDPMEVDRATTPEAEDAEPKG